ncbi:MAG: hypothetical protein J5780_04060, partial [Treponema sp.]|nr:hypothetical protein [Treponema sp.]
MSMYDRLGTLISETLEAGEIRYVKREIRQDSSEDKNFQKENDTPEINDDQQKENEKNSSFNKNNGNNSESKKTKTVYKKITPETESA